ncbi:MAG: cardiolipin synthase ClsB [Pseudomonadota bacterium]
MKTWHKSHGLELLQGGEAYFPALISAIDAAQTWVQLETYIFDMHGAGADVANALIAAAQRGVTVQVLVDGIGSGPLSADWKKKFSDAGVRWVVYSPLGRLGLLMPQRWRRLHRKLCVVDQRKVFCGGINILDDFYDPNHGDLQAPRFDFAVAAQGPLALDAAEAMALLWWRVQAGLSARHRHLSEAWEKFKAAGYGIKTSAEALAVLSSGSASAPPEQPGTRAELVLRDNLRNRSSIEKVYLRAIGHARSEILIANAYFVPGRKLRRALIGAARRGVRVTLLLQGRYEYFMQYHAARPVYDTLLKAGIEIHEYEASFLHAKVAVIDEHWATVGSSNLDPLSLLLAREANVVVEDRAFAGDLREKLCTAIAGHGRRIDPVTYSQRPLGQRILGRMAYALMRLGIWLAGQRY